MNNLATIYQQLGEYEESIIHFENCVNIRTKKQGREHSQTLIAMNNLALALKAQDNLSQKALKLFEDCYHIYKRRDEGLRNFDALTAMSNLALCYLDNAEYDSARSIFTECLEYSKAIKGDRHPDTLVVMQNLGDLELKQGQLGSARSYLEHSLSIIREIHGNYHPFTFVALDKVAMVNEKLKLFERSEDFYKEYLKLKQEKNESSIAIKTRLACLCEKQGINKYSDAQALFEEILAEQKSSHSKFRSDEILSTACHLADIYENRGDVLYEKREFRAANMFYDNCIALKAEFNVDTKSVEKKQAQLKKDSRVNYLLL
jgi:tetratricopeptide (TPR) repeat protein